MPSQEKDDFDILALDINCIITEKGKPQLKAKKAPKVKFVTMSNELKEGMSIKVYDGGREEEMQL